ncbi:hypothetical protein V8D89_004533 [Ganoderma adspersum]
MSSPFAAHTLTRSLVTVLVGVDRGSRQLWTGTSSDGNVSRYPMLAELSIHRGQASLLGSRLPSVGLTSTTLSSPTFPLSLDPISNSASHVDTLTVTLSSSTTSAASTMSVTLPGSILPPVTTTGSTLPTPVTTFTWSNFPSTIDTCTSATLSWQYTGTPETLQFILVSNASPHTLAASSRKRAGNSTTLATDVNAAAMSWNWTQVNFDAGRYVMEAYGTDVSVASSTFTITNGADTSCLLSSSSSSAEPSATSSATDSSSSSTSSATDLPVTSSNKSQSGAIAGGVVAGIAVLLAAVAAARTLPLTAEDIYEAYPLDNLTGDWPLVPNRRPPSSLLSEPDTPVSPFATHTRTRERVAASLMDVSTTGSRTSAALSDATSTAEMMRTFSTSCPPSYTTRPSPAPSYTTDVTLSAKSSSATRFSYTSSS